MPQQLYIINVDNALMDNATKLEYIFSPLSNGGPLFLLSICSDLSAEHLVKLFDHLQCANSIKALQLFNRTRGPDPLILTKLNMIADLFQTNRTIDSLDFSGNWLKEGHIKILGKILKSHNSLKVLKMSDMRLNAKKIAPIANKIHISKIIEIDISRNILSSEGLKKIVSKFYTKNNTLEILDLSYNYIGNKSTEVIPELLTYATHIKYLGLAANNIGEAGLRILTKQCLKHKSLYSIDLSRNHFNLHSLKLTTDLIESHPSLAVIKLLHCFNSLDPSKVHYDLAKAVTTSCKIIDCGMQTPPILSNALRVNVIKSIQAWNALCIHTSLLSQEEYKILISHNRKLSTTYNLLDYDDAFDYGDRILLGYNSCKNITKSLKQSIMIQEVFKDILGFVDFIARNNITHQGKLFVYNNYRGESKHFAISTEATEGKILNRGISLDLLSNRLPDNIQTAIFLFLDMHDFSSLCVTAYILMNYACRFLNRSEALVYDLFGQENMFLNLESQFVHYYKPNTNDSENDNVNARLLFNCLHVQKYTKQLDHSDIVSDAISLHELDSMGMQDTQRLLGDI